MSGSKAFCCACVALVVLSVNTAPATELGWISLTADDDSANLPTRAPAKAPDAIGQAEAVSGIYYQAADDFSLEQRQAALAKKKAALAKAAAKAYKGVYYDNDFDYLCDPCYDDWHLGEFLKRRCGWGDIAYDVGGEYRLRFQSEQNHRGLGLTGQVDEFLLHRLRLYANVELNRRVRFYGEVMDSVSELENNPPRPIEENRLEPLNFFVDFMFFDNPDGQMTYRPGRQELLYGAQRTVSPLDWANTRRTFQGHKVFWSGRDWNVDAFWTNPVPPSQGVFDDPDKTMEFMGVYCRSKAMENEKREFYYLRLVNIETNPRPFDYHTLGVRWERQRNSWMAEIEAAYQFGNFGPTNHSAGAYTLGLGRELGTGPWKPTLWVYYDWASGDDTIGNGYHHLMPLAHKYLGFMDFFGRRNIKDLNVQLAAKPTEKLKLMLWWHIFQLQNRNDVPYSVIMTPEVPTPGGSPELGQELDLLASWTITPRMHMLLGYSRFFTGEFYSTNPSPPPFAGDADFYYTQFSLKF